jgi:hypothetical protein
MDGLFVCVVASSVPLLLPGCASKRYMVLRTGPAASSGYGKDGAWAVFVPSQTVRISLQGCISQPAHAALAGRLAAHPSSKDAKSIPIPLQGGLFHLKGINVAD